MSDLFDFLRIFAAGVLCGVGVMVGLLGFFFGAVSVLRGLLWLS